MTTPIIKMTTPIAIVLVVKLCEAVAMALKMDQRVSHLATHMILVYLSIVSLGIQQHSSSVARWPNTITRRQVTCSHTDRYA